MTPRQMASIVHPPEAVRRVMAVLKAYFDESGFDGPVFTLCGFVATEELWGKFDCDWKALLKNPCKHEIRTKIPIKPSVLAQICRPLDYLHAEEMESMGDGRFRRIGQQNRTYLIDESINLIIKSGIVGVGSGVIIPEYDKLSDEVKKAVGSPYLLCMRYVLAEIAKQASMFVGETEDIAYVFEDQFIWELKAHALFAELRQSFEQEYRMGSIAFGSKKKFTPLQAADRLAYETFRHFSERSTNRRHWHRFVEHPLITGKYCDEQGVAGLAEVLNIKT